MARAVWTPADPWEPPVDAELRLETCVAAARAVLDVQPMNDRLLAGLLDQVFWHATVHPDKYRIRWRSVGVVVEQRRPLGRYVRHEHVFERAWLRSQLVTGKDPAEVLPLAVACLVTVEEDARLRAVDRELVGWERYRAAGVDVIDMATRERADLVELSRRYAPPS